MPYFGGIVLERGMDFLGDRPSPQMNDRELEARVNELVQHVFACEKGLQRLQGRQPAIPVEAAALPLPEGEEYVIISQSQEFQEIIDRRNVLQRNLSEFKDRFNKAKQQVASPELNQKMRKAVKDAADVIEKISQSEKEIGGKKFAEALENYKETTNCKNAEILQESIAALVRKDKVAKQHNIDLKIDMEPVKQGLIAAKQTLVAQYQKDLDNFKNDQSYSNAMALSISATSLAATEEIGKLFDDIDLQLGDMKIVDSYATAMNKMKEIRDEIAKELSDLVELPELAVPENIGDGPQAILEDKIVRLEGMLVLLKRRIEDVFSAHAREIANGRSLSEQEKTEILDWEESCQSLCTDLGEKLSDERRVIEAIPVRRRGFLDAVLRRLSSIFGVLEQMKQMLSSLMGLSPAQGVVEVDLDAIIGQIFQCATDLTTLQKQLKAFEESQTLPLPEAVSLILKAGCAPLSNEVIERRDALQKAMKEFNENMKHRPRGYRATPQERVIRDSMKVLGTLNTAIEQASNDFVNFGLVQQRCQEFQEAHTNYLEQLNHYDNIPVNEPQLRAARAQFAVTALSNHEKTIVQEVNGKEVRVKVQVIGLMDAINELRKLDRFRTEEAFKNDQEHLDGIALQGVSLKLCVASGQYKEALKTFNAMKGQDCYDEAMDLYEQATALLKLGQSIEENPKLAPLAKELGLNMATVKKNLQMVEVVLRIKYPHLAQPVAEEAAEEEEADPDVDNLEVLD